MSEFQPKDSSSDGHKRNNQSRPVTHGIQPRQMGRRMGRSMDNRFGSKSRNPSTAGLENTVQAKMENNTFQEDFSDAKVTKDSDEATIIKAQTSTHGDKIHFVPGNYKPHAIEEQEIAGDEKAHVFQQKPSKNAAFNGKPALTDYANVKGKRPGNENVEDPEPKTIENACPGDTVLLPDGSTAIMLEEVIVKGNRDPLRTNINLETKSTANPETELIKMGVQESFKQSGKDAASTAEIIEQDRVEKGYATSQQGKTSKFPTEQRQMKFYRTDGTEDIITVIQAKNSGNFQPGDSNKGIARTGETKFTKGLKGFADVTGLAGDFIDLASALKGLAEGDIDAVLASAPFLGPLFAGINKQSDEVMRDFLARHFTSLLFTGEPEKLRDFLDNNKEIGLELIYLNPEELEAIQNGKELNKFELEDTFSEGKNKIPTLINYQSDIIKIHATIHN